MQNRIFSEKSIDCKSLFWKNIISNELSCEIKMIKSNNLANLFVIIMCEIFCILGQPCFPRLRYYIQPIRSFVLLNTASRQCYKGPAAHSQQVAWQQQRCSTPHDFYPKIMVCWYIVIKPQFLSSKSSARECFDPATTETIVRQLKEPMSG